MWSFMGQTVEDRSHITRSSVKSIFALFILYQVKLCTLNSFLSFSHLLWRFLKVATRVNNNKRTFVRILSQEGEDERLCYLFFYFACNSNIEANNISVQSRHSQLPLSVAIVGAWLLLLSYHVRGIQGCAKYQYIRSVR